MNTIRGPFTDHGTPGHRGTEKTRKILRVSVTRWLVTACIAAFIAMSPRAAEAQSQVVFRGFADAASTTFTAQKSFKAILGSESGIVYGGGVEFVLPQRIFFDARASRFQKTGQRAFVFEGKEYPLGIAETIAITPVEVTVGYRFVSRSRLIPYGGGCVGWHRFKDTSEFADSSENFEKTSMGFQLMGGGEFRLSR